jgi:hypothetical protein
VKVEPQDQAKWMESSGEVLDVLKQLAGVGEMTAPRCDTLLESVKTFAPSMLAWW